MKNIPEIIETSKFSLNMLALEKMLLELYHAYINKKALFEFIRYETHAPQILKTSHMSFSREERKIFLFFAALSDRMHDSYQLYGAHANLFEEIPELYTEYVLTLNESKLARILQEYKIGLHNQTARNWKGSAFSLYTLFEGDPVAIFNNGGTDSFIEVSSKLDKLKNGIAFPGFGPKIISLLATFYLCEGYLSPEDCFPIDLHVQRICLQNNIVSLKVKVVEGVLMEKYLRPAIATIASLHQMHIPSLTHAIWFLGNKLCSNCHKQTMSGALCPLYLKSCKGRVGSRKYRETRSWYVDDIFEEQKIKFQPMLNFT